MDRTLGQSSSTVMNVARAIVLFSLLFSIGCANCRNLFNRKGRDVGRVQSNVGNGVAEVYPRTGVQPFNPAVLQGPMTAPTQVAQGSRLEVSPGAQVPIAPPMDGLPPGAIVPLSPNAQPAPVPFVQNPIRVAAPAPVVAAPMAVAAVQMVPTSAVAFATPGTRSSFVAVGMAVPVVPMGTQPSGAAAAGGAAPVYGGPSFLSGEPVGAGLRLHPRMAGDPTPTQTPTRPVPTVPGTASPPASDRPRNLARPTNPPAVAPPGESLVPERPPATPAPPRTPPESTRPKLEKPAPPVEEEGDLPPVPDFQLPSFDEDKPK